MPIACCGTVEVKGYSRVGAEPRGDAAPDKENNEEDVNNNDVKEESSSRGRPGEQEEGGSRGSGGAPDDQVTYVSENAAAPALHQEPGSRKKKKKKKQQQQAPATTEDIEGVVIPARASFQNSSAPAKPLPRPRSLRAAAVHAPTPEEEREMLDRAEEERRRNKQRLREQRQRERERNAGRALSQQQQQPGQRGYREAQQEIDAVLEAPESEERLPDVFRHKPRKSPSKSSGSIASGGGHYNEAFEPGEEGEDSVIVEPQQESLQEAKKRMHQLLEDAFSLISSSHSTIGSNHPTPKKIPRNKVSPREANVSDETLPVRSRKRDKQQAAATSDDTAAPAAAVEPSHKEMKHTPMFVNPPYMSEDSGLVTWSPYKAADDVTLITMPQGPEPEGKPPPHEKAKTTTFTESYPASMRNNFFATEPGKPIVIRTQDLESSTDGADANGYSSNPRHSTGNGYGARRASDTGFSGLEQFHPLPRSAPVHPQGARRASRTEGVEMQTLNGSEAHPHHRPTRDVGNGDEVDVVRDSLQPGSSPKPLIDSIRSELKQLAARKSGGGGGHTDRDVSV